MHKKKRKLGSIFGLQFWVAPWEFYDYLDIFGRREIRLRSCLKRFENQYFKEQIIVKHDKAFKGLKGSETFKAVEPKNLGARMLLS